MSATSPAGGAQQVVSSIFSFLQVLLRFVICVYVFSLFSFVFRFHRMFMSCLSYPVSCHGLALPTTAVLTDYLVRGNVVSLWHSFVTTEYARLLGLKNGHGLWLCRMSTGRNNGLT